MIYAYVALGSALGGMLRYGISSWMAPAIGGSFPWWTLLINVLGSFVIGYAASYPAMPVPLRAVLIPGFCGGFTTFSAFSLETVALWRGEEVTKSILYAFSSLFFCAAATLLGHRLAR